MENTIKNMELALTKMEMELNNEGINQAKTLSNTYSSLLKQYINSTNYKVPLDLKHFKSLNRQHIRLLNLSDTGNQMVSRMLEDQRYVDANNLSVASDKLIRSASELKSFLGNEARINNLPQNKKTEVVKKKEFPINQVIQDLLDLSVKGGILVTFFDETHRGYGKTTALIKKAAELDAVLLTGVHSQAKQAIEMAQEMGLSISAISVTQATHTMDNEHRRKITENGYLIDETVTTEGLRLLKNYKLLGGFNRVVI